jgi:hypothetical protein
MTWKPRLAYTDMINSEEAPGPRDLYSYRLTVTRMRTSFMPVLLHMHSAFHGLSKR